jgi:hypothetical protein
LLFVDFRAYQNGVELDGHDDSDENMPETANFNRLIYPGVTMRATVGFALQDDSPVELFLEEQSVELDLGELQEPGPAPERVLVPEPEDLSRWPNFAGAKSSLEYMDNSFDLSIAGHEFSEYDGAKVLVVYYDFTVTEFGASSGSLTDAYFSANFAFFQDGIELKPDRRMSVFFDVPQEVQEVSADVAVGETVRLAEFRPLVNDSPVSVLARAGNFLLDTPFVGGVYPVE